MKHFIFALVLALGCSYPPQHAKAAKINIEPGILIETPKLLSELPEIKHKTAEHMDLVGLSFAPIGSYSNPFPYDQCTYGAASMKGNVTWRGNANQWDDQALMRGIAVSSVPIVGAIAQTDRGASGHVAVVTAVYPDHIMITERNYDYNGSDRTRTASYDEFKYIYL